MKIRTNLKAGGSQGSASPYEWIPMEEVPIEEVEITLDPYLIDLLRDRKRLQQR